mgnify:CR=1 FL=1
MRAGCEGKPPHGPWAPCRLCDTVHPRDYRQIHRFVDLSSHWRRYRVARGPRLWTVMRGQRRFLCWRVGSVHPFTRCPFPSDSETLHQGNDRHNDPADHPAVDQP